MVCVDQRRNLSHSGGDAAPGQAKNLAVGRIQRGKQSGRTVSFVVVRHGGAAPALQRQARLGTIQSLNLALLIRPQTNACPADRDTSRRCLPVLREGRIVADLEGLHAMRLQTRGAPEMRDAGLLR